MDVRTNLRTLRAREFPFTYEDTLEITGEGPGSFPRAMYDQLVRDTRDTQLHLAHTYQPNYPSTLPMRHRFMAPGYNAYLYDIGRTDLDYTQAHVLMNEAIDVLQRDVQSIKHARTHTPLRPRNLLLQSELYDFSLLSPGFKDLLGSELPTPDPTPHHTPDVSPQAPKKRVRIETHSPVSRHFPATPYKPHSPLLVPVSPAHLAMSETCLFEPHERKYTIPVLDAAGFTYKVYDNTDNTGGTCVFHALAVALNVSLEQLACMLLGPDSSIPDGDLRTIFTDYDETREQLYKRLLNYKTQPFSVNHVHLCMSIARHKPRLGFVVFRIETDAERDRLGVKWHTLGRAGSQTAVSCIFNPGHEGRVEKVVFLLRTRMMDGEHATGHLEIMSVAPKNEPKYLEHLAYNAATVKDWVKRWGVHSQCANMFQLQTAVSP